MDGNSDSGIDGSRIIKSGQDPGQVSCTNILKGDLKSVSNLLAQGTRGRVSCWEGQQRWYGI